MTDDTIRRAEARDLIADALVWSSPSNHAPNIEALPLHRREQWRIRADAVLAALHSAGMLAPAPLQEEWGVRWHPDDPVEDIWDHYLSRSDAERGAGDEGAAVRRYMSDWEPADRAEDDGFCVCNGPEAGGRMGDCGIAAHRAEWRARLRIDEVARAEGNGSAET